MSFKSIKIKNAPEPKILSWGKGEDDFQDIPKIIWMFWQSKKPSIFVNICIENLKKRLADYEIRVIDFDNIDEYITNPPKFNDLPLANIADWIRLYLIKEFGGYWLDASILVTDNFKWIEKLKIQYKSEFVGFYSDDCTINLEYPIVENWFFGAPKHSKFITDWFVEYNNCIFSGNRQVYYKDLDASVLQNIWNPSYLLPYVSVAVIMRRNKDYKLTLIKAGDMGHFYSYNYVFTQPCVIQNVMLFSKPPQIIPKIIKMTSGGRSALDSYLEKGFYNFSSLLFNIIDEKNIDKKLRVNRLLQFFIKKITRSNIKSI
ncbi:capsular polysaccharide synthesis protein [Epilithonimonas ginsengisoli]|uniref:Capsular polysaccharide synthesis protein n=1 Tax=Epilithonimonas ginsengisoli TaxID=1245592 RepID=A0ABU4JIM0_9FLAO|nr:MULTISPECIES: capsular polysaccharide synthesis protein [Chryseobacterium group]MBV6879084.1 capsular polysaccharide synthesis protein [Epilithonimonas sp. FP105]MDW8549518.1 capsular polysaccharide synthesis protein [Epilithonimonas ginsengisoli]OAH74383.1 hypothetical protein AXA65_06375 [Chryseobacterium sp. FP211-J200]